MTLPLALITAPRLTLGDFSGYLAMVSLDGDVVSCPVCRRAVALVEIRQQMPSCEWVFSCLACAQ